MWQGVNVIPRFCKLYSNLTEVSDFTDTFLQDFIILLRNVERQKSWELTHELSINNYVEK